MLFLFNFKFFFCLLFVTRLFIFYFFLIIPTVARRKNKTMTNNFVHV